MVGECGRNSEYNGTLACRHRNTAASPKNAGWATFRSNEGAGKHAGECNAILTEHHKTETQLNVSACWWLVRSFWQIYCEHNYSECHRAAAFFVASRS